MTRPESWGADFIEEDDAPEDDALEEASSGVDLGLDDEAAPASVRSGAAIIRRHWRTLPLGPGVYRMIGADGDVLYVGKARSLKKRVASYTRAAGHTGRIARMIAATVQQDQRRRLGPEAARANWCRPMVAAGAASGEPGHVAFHGQALGIPITGFRFG